MDTNTEIYKSPINTGDALKKGIEIFKKNWGVLALSMLTMLLPVLVFVAILASIILLQPTGKNNTNSMSGLICLIPFLYLGLIYIILWMGFNFQKICFEIYDGNIVKVSDMFKSPTNKLWTLLLVALVVEIAVSIGMWLLVFPGIYVGLMFMFAQNLVVDKGLGVGDALNISGKLTDGKKMELFVFMLAYFGIVLVAVVLGIVTFGIGYIPFVFIAGSVVQFAHIHIYRTLLANYESTIMPQNVPVV